MGTAVAGKQNVVISTFQPSSCRLSCHAPPPTCSPSHVLAVLFACYMMGHLLFFMQRRGSTVMTTLSDVCFLFIYLILFHRSYFTTEFLLFLMCYAWYMVYLCVCVCTYITVPYKLQVCLTRTSLYYMCLQQQFLELKKNTMCVIAYCDVVHV